MRGRRDGIQKCIGRAIFQVACGGGEAIPHAVPAPGASVR